MTLPDALAESGTPPAQDVNCPYVGLQPFEATHAGYFFGRERAQRLIIANLIAQPLTILYGSSGVGKSSVLNAGVLPQLQRQRPATPVIIFSEWARADFRLALARACIEATWAKKPQQPRPSPELPFDEVLRACAEAVHETLLIVFDQFEEYFVYHPKSAAPDSFEAEFARAVNREDVDVGFLLALRDDGLAKLDHFQERIPNLLNNRLRLRHLDEAGARMAIRGPLEVWNARPAAAGQPVAIDDDLVTQLIQQVRVGHVSVARQAGSGIANREQEEEIAIEAPFLQLVLFRLWEKEQEQGSRRLRTVTLSALGGAKSIVGQHLDLAMQRLDDTERAVCANVFDRLVTPTGGKIACSREALIGWAGPELADHVAGVLNALCNPRVRILRPTELMEQRDKDAYEVFHDVLAPAILEWRSRYLARRKQQQAIERERKEAAARAEREREELNRRAERDQAAIRRRALTRLLLASGVLTLIALAGWCFSFVEGRRAEANSAAAESLLAGSRDEPLNALDQALEAVDETGSLLLPPTQAAQDALRQSLRILPNLEQKVAVADLVSSVAVSADGQLAASGGRDRRVSLWTLQDGQLHPYGTPLPQSEWVRAVAFLPPVAGSSGHRLLAVAGDTVRLYDLDHPASEPRLFVHGSPIYGAFAVSADNRRIATFGWEGEDKPAVIKVWDLDAADGSPPVEIDLGGARVMGLAFSPDGCCLATAAVTAGGLGRSFTEIWSIARRQRVATVPNNVESDAVSFSPNGDSLITVGRDGLGRIFRPAPDGLVSILSKAGGVPVEPREIGTAGIQAQAANEGAVAWETTILTGHTDRIRNLAVSADGTRISTAGGDTTIRMWDQTGGQTLFVLRGHTHYVEGVAFTPDGRLLVSGARDKTLRLWNVGRHAGSINAIAFAPGGDLIATAGADGTAKLWSVKGDVPELVRTLSGHGREVYQLAFDASGETLATAGFDGSVRLWDVKTGETFDNVGTGKTLAILRDHADQLRDVAFDASGRYLASASADGYVYLHDLADHEAPVVALRHAAEGGNVQVQAVAISPREDLIATAGNNSVIRLWTHTGDDRGRLERKGVSIFRDLAFRPDGEELAALGIRQLVVWPKESLAGSNSAPRLIVDLRTLGLPAGGSCDAIAYNNDGSRLAVACNDGSTYLLAMPSGRLVDTITAHDGAVRGVAFSPDGRRLATASTDGTFLVAPINFHDLDLLARRLQARAHRVNDDELDQQEE